MSIERALSALERNEGKGEWGSCILLFMKHQKARLDPNLDPDLRVE